MKPLETSIKFNRTPRLQRRSTAGSALFLIPLLLGYCAISPMAQAVSPPPDGGYPGFNTAEGQNALNSLTTGIWNVADGAYALWHDTDGSYNTAVGTAALLLNVGDQTTGEGLGNTAIGTAALLSNTTGANNTGLGFLALEQNNIGGANTATGVQALQNNAAGSTNTGFGAFALSLNIIGSANTAIGANALGANTVDANTAVGAAALQLNSTGMHNTAVGTAALAGANQTNGSFNVYVGDGVGGVAGEIGQTYIRNINLVGISGGGTDTVTVELSTGRLGHLSSSRRYKEDITPMSNASEALYRLKPVTYRYKKEIDPTQSPAFGLIAEEVAEVNPALVAHNAKGQPESVHYEMVNAMLLNEFLKEHKEIEQQQIAIGQLKSKNASQEVTISALEKELGVVTAQIKAQAAQIEKVSAQVEVSKALTQMAANR
jgi:hypothetical protein